MWFATMNLWWMILWYMQKSKFYVNVAVSIFICTPPPVLIHSCPFHYYSSRKRDIGPLIQKDYLAKIPPIPKGFAYEKEVSGWKSGSCCCLKQCAMASFATRQGSCSGSLWRMEITPSICPQNFTRCMQIMQWHSLQLQFLSNLCSSWIKILNA